MLFQSDWTTVVESEIDALLAAAGGCSLVVPVRVYDISCLAGFQEHYRLFIDQMGQAHHWEMMIVDASPEPIFAAIDGWFDDIEQVRHLQPTVQDLVGHNNKLLGLCDILPQARFRYALLLDHDMRLSVEAIRQIVSRMQHYDCARCMVRYQSFQVGSLINLNGIFLINLLCSDKQFWGHLLINREMLLSLGFPATNTLFDELTIMRHIRGRGGRIGYFPMITIPMAYQDTPARFFEQRLRYAYENLAYPFRFVVFLSVIPTLLMSLFISPLATLLLFLAMTFGIIVLGYIGQKWYANDTCPFYTFLYAPVWFWLYPFFSWAALGFLLKGGIKFGGQIIRQPV